MFVLTEARYQLFRHKGRTLLMLALSALLAVCVCLYMGNIAASQQMLDALNETAPAVVHVVSHDVSSTKNLTISAQRLDTLAQGGVRDILATSQASGEWGGEGPRENFSGGDTRLLGVTCLEAAGFRESTQFAYGDGVDASFLEGEENLCLVDAGFAQEHQLAVGSELTLPVYLVKYRSDTLPVYVWISDLTLRAAGTFQSQEPAGYSADIYVPANWLRAQVEAVGEEFTYNSLEGSLADSMALNSFKASIPSLGFYQPVALTETGQPDRSTGDTIYLDDEQFITTAEQLGGNLRQFRGLALPFFVLVAGLVALSVFLALRGGRRDMKLSWTLGYPKRLVGLSHLLSALVVQLAGCAVCIPAAVWLAGLAPGEACLVCGAFLLCAMIGDLLALALLLRFDGMALQAE